MTNEEELINRIKKLEQEQIRLEGELQRILSEMLFLQLHNKPLRPRFDDRDSWKLQAEWASK